MAYNSTQCHTKYKNSCICTSRYKKASEILYEEEQTNKIFTPIAIEYPNFLISKVKLTKSTSYNKFIKKTL